MHPCRHFFDDERLYDVVISTGGQECGLGFDSGLCGQDEDGSRIAFAPVLETCRPATAPHSRPSISHGPFPPGKLNLRNWPVETGSIAAGYTLVSRPLVFLAARPNGVCVASFEIADAPSLVATRLSRQRWQPHLDASRATRRFANPSSRAAALYRWLRIVCHEEGKHFVENRKQHRFAPVKLPFGRNPKWERRKQLRRRASS